MSFLSRMFKHKKNDDDGDLEGLDELDADEKEGLFIDNNPRVETAGGTAAPAAAPAAAAAPLDADGLDTAEPPGPEPAASEPTADEANKPAPAPAPTSDGPTAGAVAEAQITAAQAQTAAAEAQIVAAQAPAVSDPLEEADGDGSLELDQDEEESPQGEQSEKDGDGEDEDDPLAAFRGPVQTSLAGELTKDIDDVTMEEVVTELREVRSMLPTIGPESSTESSEA